MCQYYSLHFAKKAEWIKASLSKSSDCVAEMRTKLVLLGAFPTGKMTKKKLSHCCFYFSPFDCILQVC